jgi:hypothetical protein
MADPSPGLAGAAAYLFARAAGKPPPSVEKESLTEGVAELLRELLPDNAAPDVIAALRAATVAQDVTRALAGEPQHILRADDVLREARILGEAQNWISKERMLDAEAVGALLGSQSETNRRQYANAQRQRGDLLGLPRLNTYLYPAFQFDIARRCVRETAVRVNRLLGANEDPWGVASWWTTPSERLGSRPPKELLGTEEEHLLVELASAELAPIG